MADKKIVTHIYAKIANEYAQSFRDNPNSVESKVVLDFVNLLSKNSKILDVGCGNCDYYDYFVKNGIDYTGVDISKGMIEVAKKMHPSGNFNVMDMRYIDFPVSLFDGIFAFFSLIHIPKTQVDGVLKSFKRVLVDEGKVLLALQEGSGEIFSESRYLKGEMLFLNLYTEKEITDKLFACGFRVIKIVKRKPTSTKEQQFGKLYVFAEKM